LSAGPTVHGQKGGLDSCRGQGQPFRLCVEARRGCRAYQDGGQRRETRGELTCRIAAGTTTQRLNLSTGQKLNQRSDNPSPASAMIADGKPMIQRSRVRAFVCRTPRTNRSPRVISL